MTEAIYDTGYNSNARFYADATARLGMIPSEFRAGGTGTEIHFAVDQCSLGATASYAETAQRIGQVRAARAAARACASNEIALAIPCHRVVRKDAALCGYRWGVERKRALLEREAAR